ncbi:MerR family transcriptional regulator [Streptomyces sp. FH025]|uniref:MerR family transcriptional regulator n=1 Tax=Streptomyces sp. FH025 TaxID=2815937 RepID=UPI001A9ED854|nr:MerR family transcriptional regulator [Streptomyces sp. FH025]MBO1414910.1 MerR family transcriptional regulator [Streptomyces sp. FH025]
MRIGELSRRTGVSPRLLRYYEEQGLLTPTREGNGYRSYPANAVRCVQQIRELLDSGLSTRALRSVIPCLNGSVTLPDAPGAELTALLRRELAQLNERIDCLTRNRDAIRDYLEPRS